MGDADGNERTAEASSSEASSARNASPIFQGMAIPAGNRMLSQFLDERCDSLAEFNAARPKALAWIRALKEPGRGPAHCKRTKALCVEDLAMAPFRSLRLSSAEKGSAFRSLSESIGHACAPMKSYGSELSAIQAATKAAHELDADAGAWVQRAIDQGMDRELLQSKRTRDEEFPSDYCMLPDGSGRAHPQFHLAFLALEFGWARSWSLTEVFDRSLHLTIEQWSRFSLNQAPGTLTIDEKKKQWDDGLDIIFGKAMPAGSRLDAKRYDGILRHSVTSEDTAIKKIIEERGWLPIEQWAKDTPPWLQSQLDLFVAEDLGRQERSFGRPDESLRPLAFQILAEKERQALGMSVQKKSKRERRPSL